MSSSPVSRFELSVSILLAILVFTTHWSLGGLTISLQVLHRR